MRNRFRDICKNPEIHEVSTRFANCPLMQKIDEEEKYEALPSMEELEAQVKSLFGCVENDDVVEEAPKGVRLEDGTYISFEF